MAGPPMEYGETVFTLAKGEKRKKKIFRKKPGLGRVKRKENLRKKFPGESVRVGVPLREKEKKQDCRGGGESWERGKPRPFPYGSQEEKGGKKRTSTS